MKPVGTALSRNSLAEFVEQLHFTPLRWWGTRDSNFGGWLFLKFTEFYLESHTQACPIMKNANP
jgi:hypothetical protein